MKTALTDNHTSAMSATTDSNSSFKTCAKCGETKPADPVFFRIRNGKPESPCRECTRLHDRQYRQRLGPRPRSMRNAEQAREYDKEYRKKNPDRLRAKEEKRPVRQRNDYYQKHRDELTEAARKWKKEHPAERRAHDARRRAAEYSADGWQYTTHTLVAMRWKMWGDKCWMCGAPATCTDHVIPLSKGGSHWPSNLRPACTACNCSKHAKAPTKAFVTKGKHLTERTYKTDAVLGTIYKVARRPFAETS